MSQNQHLTFTKRLLIISTFLSLWISTATAEVTLPKLFSNDMVLQQGIRVPIWGWANPDEKITVKLADRAKTTRADKNGKWMLKLDKCDAGGPYKMTVSGTNKMEITGVLVGEVWLCSGQSNMAMTLRGVNNSQKEIAEANDSMIRMFTVKKYADGLKPADNCGGQWLPSGPQTAGSFSATAYFFGLHLRKKLKVPIGLINSSWGGTCIEAWTDRKALRSVTPGRKMIEQWENRASTSDFDKAKQRYEKQLAKWQEDRKAGIAKGRKPKSPVEPNKNQNGPGALYNGMIAPLVPYAIKGAIWYQGERNSITAETSYAYRQLLPNMISNWRQDWGQGDFHFLFVQLPNFQTERSWPLIRESMLKTLQIPQTGMAVTIDIGEARNIHPRNKQDVGKRLAIAALGGAYGEDIVYSGPIYESMKVEGKKVTLSFKHVGSGLIAKGGKLDGFTIAGENRNFVAAEAIIKNNVVIVASENIDKPVAVRYAWENNPACNLYNRELLPASSFRTDNW